MKSILKEKDEKSNKPFKVSYLSLPEAQKKAPPKEEKEEKKADPEPKPVPDAIEPAQAEASPETFVKPVIDEKVVPSELKP